MRRPHVLLLALLLAAAPVGCGGADPAPDYEAVGAETDAEGRPRRIRHLETGHVLRLVDAGTYTMGTPDDEPWRDGDELLHEVTLDAPFYLGEAEVTVAEWLAVLDDTDVHVAWGDDHPVGGVSWYRAQDLVDALNEGRPRAPWRLPTETEWEYACRAGTTTPFSFGDAIDLDVVHYNARYPYEGGRREDEPEGPRPVRSLPPNPWGFHDMHGNLWEWCEDPYVFDLSKGPPEEPDEGMARVMRGGAWTSAGKEVRSGFREGYAPSTDGKKYGVRLARDVEG